jgi:hypothetical protein
MARLGIAFPIQTGQSDEARRFAAEVMGPRHTEYLKTLEREGITRETWHLQETPNGDMVIVSFDSPDPGKSLAHWATADSEYEVWFVDQVQRICGVDLRAPVPALPQQIVAHGID